MGKDTLTLDLFAALDTPEKITIPAVANSFQQLADSLKDVAYSPVERPDWINENKRRDGICQEWRSCHYADTCMDETINIDCVCYQDMPERFPKTAFSRDESKVLAGGFNLVKYSRDEKMIWISETTPYALWAVVDTFNTYAAAERKLKELKAAGYIETSLTGKIIMTGWNQPGGLLKAGFEFYRCYGLNPFDQVCCIKIGSKNWSNMAKYTDENELQKAWIELMATDPKALEG